MYTLWEGLEVGEGHVYDYETSLSLRDLSLERLVCGVVDVSS